MSFIEFNAVFIESEAPEVKAFCRLDSIDYMYINTAGDDTDNTGDYYVWLYLSNGEHVPCFAGSLESCKERYEMIKKDIIKSEALKQGQ